MPLRLVRSQWQAGAHCFLHAPLQSSHDYGSAFEARLSLSATPGFRTQPYTTTWSQQSDSNR